MTDLRKAAEMALEALEELRFANAPFLDEAMEALRQALAQDALRKLAEIDHELGLYIDGPKQDLEAPLTINGVALYPKREWVGLTDAERKACWHDSLGFYRTIETASKEIERLLKEKNYG